MNFTQLSISLALASSLAWGNEHVTQIRDHAAQLERQYREMGAVVKSKAFQPADVQTRLDAANASLGQLKQLVSDLEASNAVPASHADWQKTKTLVALIDIFHNEKAAALATDPVKKRSLLKSHAEGLVMRSSMLQQSSARLLKQLSAGS